MTLIMFGLIAVLIIFMIRNGKKRRQAAEEMQNNLRPGAEVMLQSGIFATVEEVDEVDHKVTVRSGNSTLVVHRNAVGQIIIPVDAPEAPAGDIAPDDDPEFGERVAEANGDDAAAEIDAAEIDAVETDAVDSEAGQSGTEGDAEGDSSKA
jgi:preprotein translocase subunit YajC